MKTFDDKTVIQKQVIVDIDGPEEHIPDWYWNRPSGPFGRIKHWLRQWIYFKINNHKDDLKIRVANREITKTIPWYRDTPKIGNRRFFTKRRQKSLKK